MDMKTTYRQTMDQIMQNDDKVVIIDADLAKCVGTDGLYKKYPDRCFEVGIAEQDMTSIAAGLASYGFKPYIHSFTAFATRRNCDQIAISVCYAKQNVKIIGADPGISAQLNGGTHMSIEDIGVLRSIPGIVIFEPVDEFQLKKALPVINEYNGPVYIRLFRKDAPVVFDENYEFDLFKADVIKEGTDVSVFVTGLMLSEIIEADEELKKMGINAEIINIHTIKPIDAETVLKSVAKTGCAVTVENHNVIGGLKDAVLETICEHPVPLKAMGVEDRFGEVGKLPYLQKVMGMTKERYIELVKQAVALKK